MAIGTHGMACAVEGGGRAAEHTDEVLELLQAWPQLNMAQEMPEDSDPEEFLCGRCEAVFTTPGGVATHRLKAHADLPNLPLAWRKAVIGTSCPVCGTDFHLRLRVLHHLRSSGNATLGSCREEILAGGLAEHSPELVAAADAADAAHRKACRRLGVHVLAGPPCCEVWLCAAV